MRAALQLATVLLPGAEREVALLARSLRDFGGRFADLRLRVYAAGDDFAIPEELREVPYADVACAAAAAEEACEADAVAFLAPDTLVLRPLDVLEEFGDRDLLCRPVHHRLIGSLASEPLDDFWREVYKVCGVRESSVWTMPTCADPTPIRAYWNAGCLVARPEHGLSRAWREALVTLARNGTIQGIIASSERHRIFLHQAALAGMVLARLPRERVGILPQTVNYPLNLGDEVAEAMRPRFEDLVTARYDSLDNPKWREALPVGERLASWLAEHAAG